MEIKACLLIILAALCLHTAAQSTLGNNINKAMMAQDKFGVCTSDTDCKSDSTFLSCQTGVCRCNQDSHFEAEDNVCIVHVQGVCTVKGGKKKTAPCVRNAKCDSNDSSGKSSIGKCACKKGFNATQTGLCSSAHRIFQVSNLLVIIGTLWALTTNFIT